MAYWSAVQEIQPGQYVIDDYDFKAPGNDLQVVRRAENTPKHGKAEYEIFDYPGEYDSHGEGEHYVANRIEEQTRGIGLRGRTAARCGRSAPAGNSS